MELGLLRDFFGNFSMRDGVEGSTRGGCKVGIIT